MSKDVDWKLRQEPVVLKPNDVQWKSRKLSIQEDWNFSHWWDLFVAGAAWNPPVCCSLERGGFLFMSKDAEWKLRQGRGVLGVEAEGCAVEIEEKENEKKIGISAIGGIWSLQPQPCNPHVCCTLERGGFLFMSKDVDWKLRQERGVFGVEPEGRSVQVEKVVHEED